MTISLDRSRVVDQILFAMSQAQVEADIKSWTGRQYDMIIDIPQLVILPEEEPTMQWHCYLNQRFKPILMNYLPQLDCRQKQKPKAAAVASIVADPEEPGLRG